MKTSPKLILSLLALGLCAAAPLARAAGQATTEVAPQAPATPDKAKHPMAGKRLKKAVAERDKALTEKLKLTAEQQEKLTAIRKDQAEQLKAGAKPADVAKTGHDQVRALLTPEQQKDFDAMPPEGRGGKKAKKGEQP